MKNFIINLFEYENFTLYLGIVIGVLIVAFFVVFFIGKKDQKEIEKTQRLEKLNIEEFNKNTTVVNTTVENTINIDKPKEIENVVVNESPEVKLTSEDVFANFNNLANSISNELDEMEKVQNEYNELKNEKSSVEVKETVQNEIPIKQNDIIVDQKPIIETANVINESIQESFKEENIIEQEVKDNTFSFPEAPVLPDIEKQEDVNLIDNNKDAELFDSFDINAVNNYVPDEEKVQPLEPVTENVVNNIIDEQPIFFEKKQEEIPISIPEYEQIVFDNSLIIDDEKDAIININEIKNEESKNEEVVNPIEEKTFTPSTVFSSVYAPVNMSNTNNNIYEYDEEEEIELPRLK